MTEPVSGVVAGVVAAVEVGVDAANAGARLLDGGARFIEALADAKLKPVSILRDAKATIVNARDGSAIAVFDGDRCDAKGVCRPDVVVVQVSRDELPTMARQFADASALSAKTVAAEAAKVAANHAQCPVATANASPSRTA